MSLQFSIVKPRELDEICQFYQRVIENMQQRGLAQWKWGIYPTEQVLKKDVEQGVLYEMKEDDRRIGVFALCPEQEAEYAQVSWHFGVKPATLHRLALLPDRHGLGLAQKVVVFAKEEAKRQGYDSLRLDTSSENQRALKLFRGSMEREAGTIYFEFSSAKFHCFESPVGDACPRLPIRMSPAYRFGEMTPWGGDGLRTLFHKDIPEERTGESLEISAIVGLESRDEAGVGLQKLLREDGKALTGSEEPFPLLLKLISARDSLSVQVHPEDAYAREKEGKLGKSEAWVILWAEEGANILYGMKPEITAEKLETALHAGEDIAPMIRQVPVKAGDVFYIPGGMVHAIGGGIVLYEIQQSSDVTYRLWDFQRVNEKGERRELHLRQALDVMKLESCGQQTFLPKADCLGIHSVLSVPAFTLDCACVSGEIELAPHRESFRMLTALAGLNLKWAGSEMEISAGESVLLPAACPSLVLYGVGRALIAAVK